MNWNITDFLILFVVFGAIVLILRIVRNSGEERLPRVEDLKTAKLYHEDRA